MPTAMPLSKVSVYTDGACKGNPGPGGYGAVMLCEGARQELSGGYRLTTNNRMELMALLQALQDLTESCELEIYTDSQYLVGGFQKGWIKGWKRNGWLTSSKEPVLNRDLWEALDGLLAKHRYQFHWVRGHASNVENNRCDQLAVSASHGKRLQEDSGYFASLQGAKELKRQVHQEQEREKRAPRAQKRPEDWDDDLFSAASKASGEPVNWDF